MKNVKAKVAAGATVITLGGLTGLALSQGGTPPSKPVADKPVVHTKVIRRTIHVTKHAKPKHPPAAAPVEPARAASPPVTTGSSGGGSESAPVSTGSSSSGTETEAVTTGSSSTGSETAPVSTGSSGTGGGGGGEVEHEREGGGDD